MDEDADDDGRAGSPDDGDVPQPPNIKVERHPDEHSDGEHGDHPHGHGHGHGHGQGHNIAHKVGDIGLGIFTRYLDKTIEDIEKQIE